MSETVTLLNPGTGEMCEVDGGDDETAKQKRQFMYMQGWKRLDRMKCSVQWDMYRCDHKRRHPERFHLLHLYDLSVANQIEGKTLQAITLQVNEAYEAWHVDRLYCVRELLGNPDCVHVSDQNAQNIDTEDYLKHLGYAESYEKVNGTWIGVCRKGNVGSATTYV